MCVVNRIAVNFGIATKKHLQERVQDEGDWRGEMLARILQLIHDDATEYYLKGGRQGLGSDGQHSLTQAYTHP